MVMSLTELLKTYPDNVTLVATWVNAVFPLILDVEAKAAEKVLECVWDCLFVNLVHQRKSATVEHQLPWIILKQVGYIALWPLCLVSKLLGFSM